MPKIGGLLGLPSPTERMSAFKDDPSVDLPAPEGFAGNNPKNLSVGQPMGWRGDDKQYGEW